MISMNFSTHLIEYFLDKKADEIIQYLRTAIDSKSTEVQPKIFDHHIQSTNIEICKNYYTFCQNFCIWQQARQSEQTKQFGAFKHVEAFLGDLRKILEDLSLKEIWFLPVIKFVIRQSKILFTKADQAAKQHKKNDNLLEKIINLNRDILVVCNKAKGFNDFKKRLILLIVNQLYSLNFCAFNYVNAETLLKQVTDWEITKKNILELKETQYQKSEIIHQLYYVSRMNIFYSQFTLAENDLQMAFDLCPNKEKKNKKLLLKYLIPIQILCGQKPDQEQIFQQYNLQEYQILSDSVFKGDMFQLDAEINQYKQVWIRRGLYMVMDQLKLITMRNLCKQVYRVLENQPQISLENLATAFNYSSQSTNYAFDEVACIVGNLIYMGLIKGYIYQNSLLVLSQNNAFPLLTDWINSKNNSQFDMFS